MMHLGCVCVCLWRNNDGFCSKQSSGNKFFVDSEVGFSLVRLIFVRLFSRTGPSSPVLRDWSSWKWLPMVQRAVVHVAHFVLSHCKAVPSPQHSWGCTSALQTVWGVGGCGSKPLLLLTVPVLAHPCSLCRSAGIAGSFSLRLALLSENCFKYFSTVWGSCQERVQCVLQLWATHREMLPVQGMQLAATLSVQYPTCVASALWFWRRWFHLRY